MSIKKIFCFLIIVGLGIFRCKTEETEIPAMTNTREITVGESQIVESETGFGLELFKTINAVEKDKNIFISPLSISMALGMTLNGANGSTFAAMKSTLQLQGSNLEEINKSYQGLIELLGNLDPKVIFEIANSIWYRQEFTVAREFIDLNKTYFNSQVKPLDFNNPGAPGDINRWVDETTHRKIKQIIDKISPEAVMFLINAIYFKGAWTFEFVKDKTVDDVFYLADGAQTPCKMMEQSRDFNYFVTDDFEAIDLLYGAGDFSMMIFLPRLQKNLDSLIAEFNKENWSLWLKSFTRKPGTIQLPKFTVTYETSLNKVLTMMGMEIAFSQTGADFTRIHKDGNLYISDVKHKTFVEVNEEGTEAAAVTSVEVRVTSIGSPAGFTMRVDRPFVFVIREQQSQSILFIGKIIKPVL